MGITSTRSGRKGAAFIFLLIIIMFLILILALYWNIYVYQPG